MDYKKLFDMTGKVCVVTGGTGYLCSTNVQILKQFGGTVVVFDCREDETRWENDGTDRDMFVQCDLASTDAIREAFKKVYDTYGNIDVLVNGVAYGSARGRDSILESMSDEVWEQGIDGTLSSMFRCTREAIPYMKEKGGAIVNYCSMYGVVAPDLRIYGEGASRQPPTYGAAKGGVLQFTRYCASDLARYGIRVNCVTPGPFPNPKSQEDVELTRILVNKTMLGRIGENHDIAGAVLLLASDAGSFMTGSNITVDGGWTAW